MILNQVLILHVYTYITLVLRFAQFFNLLTVVYLFIFHPLHRVDAWGYFSSISNRNSEEKRYLWEEYNFNWHMLRVRLYGGWTTSKLMKLKIRFQGTIYSPTWNVKKKVPIVPCSKLWSFLYFQYILFLCVFKLIKARL